MVGIIAMLRIRFHGRGVQHRKGGPMTQCALLTGNAAAAWGALLAPLLPPAQPGGRPRTVNVWEGVMAVRRRFWPILLLILVIGVSMIGCAEQGPQGETGTRGPSGQPGEVITITTPPPDVAPLPPEAGLTTRQAQPRVHFDPTTLPAGVRQVEVVADSPARVTVAFTLTNDHGDPIDRTALEPLRLHAVTP